MYYIIISLLLLSLYVCYYLTKCKKPDIISAHNSELAQKLTGCCAALTEVFYPSFLFAQPDLQSLTTEFNELFSSKLKLKTTRLTLPDGGEISYTEPTPECGVDKGLIFIIVPGYMGDHRSQYCLSLAETLVKTDVWPVIFTDRGKGGMAMKSAKFFSAGYNDGLECLLDHILTSNPHSNYGVIGISFGGMVTCNTLYQYHRKNEIMVQLLLSSPLDSLRTVERLNALRAKVLYSQPFGKRIKTLISNNEEVFKNTKGNKKLLKSISRSESITEIDDVFIAPMFGYSKTEDYYRNICLTRCLKDTETLTICINADDDPCFTSEMYPIEAIKQNPKVCLVSTKAGGHFGFAGLGWPYSRSNNFVHKVVRQILELIKSET